MTLVTFGAALILGWLFAAGILLWVGTRSLPAEARFDAIVVLGCRVFPNGAPTTAMLERVKLAVALYESHRAPLVITTGGTGDSGHAEAEVAAQIAIELGVPPRAVHMEARSTSTQENARYCAMQVPARAVLLVTDGYHVLRARRVFGRYFPTVAACGTRHPVLRLRIKGALREVGAVLLYGAMGWL